MKDREAWCAAVHRVAKSGTHVSLSEQATVRWASADLGAQWDDGAPCGHARFCTSTLGEWRVTQVLFGETGSKPRKRSCPFFIFISLRIDWLDLPAIQGTLKSLLQQHNSKVSIP